jgi:hypothetical protein
MAPAEIEIIRGGQTVRCFAGIARQGSWNAELEGGSTLEVRGRSGRERVVSTPSGNKPVLATVETYSPGSQSHSSLAAGDSREYPLKEGTTVEIVTDWGNPEVGIQELTVKAGDIARVTAVPETE